MPRIDQLPQARRQLLNELKSHGPCSMPELAEQMAVTREAVRQQLLQLQREGWVQEDSERAGVGRVGRPAVRFRLTPAGEHLFPKQYDALAVTVLDSISERLGPGALTEVLSAIAEAKVREWAPRLEALPLEERVRALEDLYQKADAFMEIDRDGDDFRLIERNCPYLNAALHRPALCSISVHVLSVLLGRRVVREQRFQDGHGRCVFRVRADEPFAADAPFAPEP